METFNSWLTILVLSFSAASAQAGEVIVAVASNFSAPMQDIASQFEQQYGHRVKLVFGSSGKLYAQIIHGAPFELFLSADQKKPQALEEKKLAVAGSRFTYARGALALWSPQEKLVDDQAQVLKNKQLRKLAIANPKLAPYGAAAIEVLKNLGVYKLVQNKLVRGENIAQTYQFVGTGNAELGFVALSQVLENGQLKSGSVWRVPAKNHTPIRQDGVLLFRGKNSDPARTLLRYLQSPHVARLIQAYGYQAEVER